MIMREEKKGAESLEVYEKKEKEGKYVIFEEERRVGVLEVQGRR